MSLLSRFVGVIVSPKATFEAVVAHPRWLGMLALTCVAVGLLVGGFLMTKGGQDAWLDAANAGPRSTIRQYAGMAAWRAVGGLAIVQMLVVMPIVYVVTAGILYLVFTIMSGGTASFKHFRGCRHTGPIGVLAQLFTVPMNFARARCRARPTSRFSCR